MNKELKTLWLTALRSGEYKQVKERLYDHKNNSYCCLGVLCEVAGIPKNGGKEHFISNSSHHQMMTYELEEVFDINLRSVQVLAAMNDTGNKTFSEIADYIEQVIPTKVN